MGTWARPIQKTLGEMADLDGGVALLDDRGRVLGVGEPRGDSVSIEIHTEGIASWLGLPDGTRLVQLTPRRAALGDTFTQPLTVQIS